MSHNRRSQLVRFARYTSSGLLPSMPSFAQNVNAEQQTMLLARRASLFGQFLNDSKFGNRIACFGAAPIQQIGCPDFDIRHRFLDLAQVSYLAWFLPQEEAKRPICSGFLRFRSERKGVYTNRPENGPTEECEKSVLVEDRGA